VAAWAYGSIFAASPAAAAAHLLTLLRERGLLHRAPQLATLMIDDDDCTRMLVAFSQQRFSPAQWHEILRQVGREAGSS
jgi:hypothetical protein